MVDLFVVRSQDEPATPAHDLRVVDFWRTACPACRWEILQKLGFKREYVGYRWDHFQPHSREDLAQLIVSEYF